MLSDPEGIIRSPDGFEDEKGSIADSIIELFKQQEMRARDGETSEEMPKTRLRLYSSTSADIPSYYQPGRSSCYADAINKTYLATDEKTTYAEFDPKLIENGKVHVLNKPDYEWVIPEVATYGEDFSSYRLFR